MAERTAPAVAASGEWVDEDGVRQPAGDMHAWLPGMNQTVCGLALHRAGLRRFPHVPWVDAPTIAESPAPGIPALHLCPRCAAAAGRRAKHRRWTRVSPRP